MRIWNGYQWRDVSDDHVVRYQVQMPAPVAMIDLNATIGQEINIHIQQIEAKDPDQWLGQIAGQIIRYESYQEFADNFRNVATDDEYDTWAKSPTAPGDANGVDDE